MTTVTPNNRGGWTIKETDTHFIDLCPMLYTYRVVMTPKSCPLVWDFGWCYATREAAVLAALAWNPNTEAEPVGFIKRNGFQEPVGGIRRRGFAARVMDVDSANEPQPGG